MKKILPYILVAVMMAGCGNTAVHLYVKKGREYYQKQKYQMGIRFLEKALEIDSTHNEARYYRALCFYELGHTHFACNEMTRLMGSGYAGADSTLEAMGCFYFPPDSLEEIPVKEQ